MKPNQARSVSSRQMIVRDADPETIARFTQPSRAPSKTVAPVVDALDQHMRSSKGMVMGQSMAAHVPSAMGAGAGTSSRPGSAKPAIFAGGGGSRPASKQQQRHRIASDSVWPDGPPPAEPHAAPQPQPGATSFDKSGGVGHGTHSAIAGRRSASNDIPEEFAALGLGGSIGASGRGGGGGVFGGTPGRRIQGMPFPDATAPTTGKPAASSFTPSFMAQAEALKKQSGSFLSQYSGSGAPAAATGGGYQGFNPLTSSARNPSSGGIFR